MGGARGQLADRGQPVGPDHAPEPLPLLLVKHGVLQGDAGLGRQGFEERQLVPGVFIAARFQSEAEDADEAVHRKQRVAEYEAGSPEDVLFLFVQKIEDAGLAPDLEKRLVDLEPLGQVVVGREG